MKNKKHLSNKFKISTIALLCGLSYTAGIVSAPQLKKAHEWAKDKFKKPLVSVVMSTYNREKSLAGAIDSVLNQTMTDFEFIIVNDGSTDNTAKILEEYAQKDKRIVVITHKKNMGLVAGLNSGLDKARGKYIARMDDDDKSLPFRFERQILAMEKYPHVTLIGGGFGSEATQKHTGEPVITNPDEQEISSYFRASLAHPTVFMRRNFLEKHKIRYDEQYIYAEDCGLYKKILEQGGKISALHEPVLVFAYMPGLEKPEQYIEKQTESFKKLQKDKLKPFFDAPYEILGTWNGPVNQCTILEELIKANASKNILNQELLLKKQEKKCPKKDENAVFLDHDTWSSFAIIHEDGKTLHRMDVPTETARILDQSDKHVTVKWKNYPNTETFVKNSVDEYKLSKTIKNKNIKDAKVYNTKHPHWEDNLVVLKDNTFYREALPDQTGKIIRQKNNIVTIKWDDWPNTETFKQSKNSLTFLYDDSIKK